MTIARKKLIPSSLVLGASFCTFTRWLASQGHGFCAAFLEYEQAFICKILKNTDYALHSIHTLGKPNGWQACSNSHTGQARSAKFLFVPIVFFAWVTSGTFRPEKGLIAAPTRTKLAPKRAFNVFCRSSRSSPIYTKRLTTKQSTKL